MSQVQDFEDTLNALKAQTAKFDQLAINDTVSQSVCSLRHRWTRLFSVAKAQEKVLKDSAHNWRSTREKVRDSLLILIKSFLSRLY